MIMPMIPQKKNVPAANAPAPAATTAPAPAAANAPAPAATTAPAPAAAHPTPNLPATQGPRAVVVASRPQDVVKEMFKDAFAVEWNTLGRVMANNGNFLDVENNRTAVGPEMLLELMSYQDNWQYSPGTDEDDDIQYVRYADNETTFTTGENIAEYEEAMRVAGYDKGKTTQRVVLAGSVIGGKLDGKLVQLNLSATSKAQFDRFRMQASIDIAKGKRTQEDLKVVKMTCVVETKGKNSWTKVLFDYAS